MRLPVWLVWHVRRKDRLAPQDRLEKVIAGCVDYYAHGLVPILLEARLWDDERLARFLVDFRAFLEDPKTWDEVRARRREDRMRPSS